MIILLFWSCAESGFWSQRQTFLVSGWRAVRRKLSTGNCTKYFPGTHNNIKRPFHDWWHGWNEVVQPSWTGCWNGSQDSHRAPPSCPVLSYLAAIPSPRNVTLHLLGSTMLILQDVVRPGKRADEDSSRSEAACSGTSVPLPLLGLA